MVKAAIATVFLCGALAISAPQRVYPIHAVPHGDVELVDGFWRNQLEIIRTAVLPRLLRESQSVSDRLMAIEAASYLLKRAPDSALSADVDALIHGVATSQERLHTNGHLYEAAVAHFEATGKRTLFDLALQQANLAAAASAEEKRGADPGDRALAMGLIRLFRATGVPRYYETARFLLDQQGLAAPVATRGAERATYRYAAIADVAGLEGEKAYLAAAERLWREMLSRQLALTGGIGSGADATNASAGPCASPAIVSWNARMFWTTGSTAYLDLLERALYNDLLKSDAACSGNRARTLAQMPGYIYAWEGETLFVNLYTGSRARVPLGRGPVSITQATDYPWQGDVRLRIDPETPRLFTVAFRNPAWTGDTPLDGGRYRYAGSNRLPPPVVEVNGEPFVDIRGRGGFITVLREWKPGDEVRVRFDMPIRRVTASDAAGDAAGRVAFERGPVVYALDAADLVVPADARVDTSFRRNLHGGVQVITGQALRDGRRVSFTAVPHFAAAGGAAIWVRAR